MAVFIVRPFGRKTTDNGDVIDFDEVEQKLIKPVLDELGLVGGTTELIVRAGNIRADMFQELLTAELVIADISINNANVYYELGIRHALRDRPTILIRSRADVVPFDLKTDRYLTYDRESPEGTRDALKRMVEATMVSDQADSPVYQLLPDLEPADPSTYIVVPAEFAEAVEQARAARDRAQLGLLGEETHGMSWCTAGLRLVAKAEYELGAFDSARVTWEAILRHIPADTEANLTLGTIYQRLGDLIASTQALDRALASDKLSNHDRAEALALQGRNTKVAWESTWRSKPAEARGEAALRSTLLSETFEKYQAGFLEDLNHSYSGLNALAMLTVLIELAHKIPHAWNARAEEPEDAERELRKYERQKESLQGAVKFALQGQRNQIKDGGSDIWLDLSLADFRLLTTNRPDFVRSGYADARSRLAERLMDPAAVASQFPAESAARQINMYLDLDILTENSRAALEELGVGADPAPPAPPEVNAPRRRIVVATGHRVDAPDRATPRFPTDQRFVDLARRAILAKLTEERQLAGGNVVGLSGAASGTDLLFHESCDELGIEAIIGLAIPPDAYLRESVQDGGEIWVEKYRAACSSRQVHVVNQSDELPVWVREKDGYNVFQRCNIWMMEYAFNLPDTDVTLIALWNGMAGDGPGGTEDMVRLATERGAKVVIIDSAELFQLRE